MKKIVVLTLRESFPVTHKRAGDPTSFEGKLKEREKIHTIRNNAKSVWDKWYEDIKSGRKYLSVREWTGRPYHSVQREFARFDSIGLQKIQMTYDSGDAYPSVWIDGREVPVHDVASNDGLTLEDFIDWFFGKGKENTFEGVVIHFTNFRY